MGPTRVDPLVQARSIVRQCIERDAISELLSSSSDETFKPAAQLTTQVQTTVIFVLSCISVVALVVSRTLIVHY